MMSDDFMIVNSESYISNFGDPRPTQPIPKEMRILIGMI